REKFVPKGGPDGGDGGRGGDVILRVDQHTDHLAHLFFEPVIKAKNGGHGRGKKMHGKNAPDKIVKVPIGTIVYQLPGPGPNATAVCGVRIEENQSGDVAAENSTDEEEFGKRISHSPDQQSAIAPPPSAMNLLADLVRDHQEFLLCQG